MERLNRLLEQMQMRFLSTPEGPELEVDGERPGEQLRTPELSAGASAIATIPEVRRKLVELQRAMAAEQMIVMEGRDIGTVVFPDAKYKFFLTASPEVRAHRRHLELKEKGQDVDYQQLLEEIKQRDHNDSTRAIAPLRQAEDAVRVDSSELTLEEAVTAVADTVKGILAQKGKRI